MSRNPTTDPNRSYVRTIVPTQAHENAGWMARYLNVTIAFLYTLILTRELFDCDRNAYADKLWSEYLGSQDHE